MKLAPNNIKKENVMTAAFGVGKHPSIIYVAKHGKEVQYRIPVWVEEYAKMYAQWKVKEKLSAIRKVLEIDRS